MRAAVNLYSGNIARCVPMYCTVFNEEPWNDGWSEQAAFERVSTFTRIPGFHGLAITVNGEPNAMVLGWGERLAEGWAFLIKEMCVHPDHRRTGLGTDLVFNFEKLLSDNDYTSAYLETLEAGPSMAFYSSLEFYRLPLIMMRKRLP